MSLVLTKIEDSIGTITFNHDAKRNALSEALIEELIAGFDKFSNKGVRVAVLRAKSDAKVWSAGHDVTELPKPGRDPLVHGDPLERAIRAIREFSAPVIAMVEASVWGGACELVLCCDIPIATPKATFALTPAKIGVPYNAAGLLRIMSEVDLSVVKEMFFTARPIGAKRALEVGIINHLLPADEIEAFTYEMAKQVTSLSALSIAVIKEQLIALAGARPLTPDAFERIGSARRKVYNSHDYQEGVTAFLEKRTPKWQELTPQK